MAKIQEIEQVWHNDGHRVHLRINKAELEILEVTCPHEGDAGCKNMVGDCVVKWFINRFGMECNGGVCPPSEFIDFCWTLVGDINNFDGCQVWFMPLTDDVFNAWLVANKAAGELRESQ
jgi:hypothetical protein